jgi:putative transposase
MSARFTRNARFKLREKADGWAEVYLPSIGWVGFVMSRPLPSDPSSVTITAAADGTWQLSFVVERERRPHTPTGRIAAVDVGLSAFATIVSVDADGVATVEEIQTPKFLRRRQRALTRSQRSLSRKAKGGRNRDRERRKVARLHRRVADARLDHAHQTAARLCREHDPIVTEDYTAFGATRHKRLARSANDQALGQFLRVLREKPCQHVKVHRFFPSTQLCSDCHARTGPTGQAELGVRYWTCSACGASHERDVNAAGNLLREGLRIFALDADGRSESQNACELVAKPRPGRARRTASRRGERAGSTVGEPRALT